MVHDLRTARDHLLGGSTRRLAGGECGSSAGEHSRVEVDAELINLIPDWLKLQIGQIQSGNVKEPSEEQESGMRTVSSGERRRTDPIEGEGRPAGVFQRMCKRMDDGQPLSSQSESVVGLQRKSTY